MVRRCPDTVSDDLTELGEQVESADRRVREAGVTR